MLRYPIGTSFTQIYADFQYPSKLVHHSLRMLPTEIIKLEEFDKIKNRMGFGIEVDQHKMEMGYAISKILYKLEKVEKQRAIEYIKKTYKVKDSRVAKIDLNFDLAKVEIFSYYIPAYVLTETEESIFIFIYYHFYYFIFINFYFYYFKYFIFILFLFLFLFFNILFLIFFLSYFLKQINMITSL